jgi:hypothetical protein
VAAGRLEVRERRIVLWSCFAAGAGGIAVLEMPSDLQSGRDETTPLRLLMWVGLVVFAVVALIGGIAYTLWSATH